MATFHRKLPVQDTTGLLSELASRTLDWKRGVRVRDMEKAYKHTNNGWVEGTSEYYDYSYVYKLKVNGAIFAYKSNNKDSDIAILAYDTTKSRKYSACGTTGDNGLYGAFITPVIKAGCYVQATTTSNGSAADWTNFYIMFIPTLDSTNITAFDDLLLRDIRINSLSNASSGSSVMPTDIFL